MQGNPPAEHLVTWIKQKHLEEIALFFLNAHEPVLNIVKQTGIACSFLVPLLGANCFLSQCISALSSDDFAEYMRASLGKK